MAWSSRRVQGAGAACRELGQLASDVLISSHLHQRHTKRYPRCAPSGLLLLCCHCGGLAAPH